MRHGYAFESEWAVEASPSQCWAVLERALRDRSPSWWPALHVAAVPAELRIGDEVVLEVRSPLGYRLRVVLTITELRRPWAIAASSIGDLAGRGRLDLVEAPTGTVLTWLWQVEPTRRWMRVAGVVLRPAFAAAHAVVMRRGGRGFAAAVAASG